MENTLIIQQLEDITVQTHRKILAIYFKNMFRR